MLLEEITGHSYLLIKFGNLFISEINRIKI